MPHPSAWYSWTYSNVATNTRSATTPWYGWQGNAGTADAWTIWAQLSTDSTATTITFVPAWSQWIGEVAQRADARAVADEQRRETERQRIATQAARERDRVALVREQQAAVGRAEELLAAHLSEAQKTDYDRMKAFLVEAPSGRTYRIKKGWSGNVELLNDDGAAIMRFCIHPSEECPEQDNMLAQKLLLEHDEAAFTRIANKTPLAAVR